MWMLLVVPLPLHLIERVNRFLLELHGTVELGVLREVIPRGLSRLIACDRASFNEAELDGKRRTVAPSPLPMWWPKLGDVYAAHIMDHPLLNSSAAVRLEEVVEFNDPQHASDWKKSALNHEYFVPLGVKHQLSTTHSREGTTFVGSAVNRVGAGFHAEDRAVFSLVTPHISQAWRNALAFAALQQSATETTGQALIAVDAASGAIRALSPRAAAVLRKHFATDSGGNGKLPEELRRWLGHQRAVKSDATAAPASPLVMRRDGRRFTACLAQLTPGESLLLINDEPESPAGFPYVCAALTPRESHILDWIVEGKRNAEIAIILGVSTRTVEKHVEHVLAKLKVETRAGAIRHTLDRRGKSDA